MKDTTKRKVKWSEGRLIKDYGHPLLMIKFNNDETQTDNGQEEHDMWGVSDTGGKYIRAESKQRLINKK